MGEYMTDFVYKNKLVVLMCMLIIAIMSNEAYRTWMNEAIPFVDGPKGVHFTRNDWFTISVNNPKEGKIAPTKNERYEITPMTVQVLYRQ